MSQIPNLNDRDRPRVVDRILSSRGATPAAPANDATQATPYIESGGPPQMAFAIEQANGELHGFQYYNVEGVKFSPTKSGDHLSFHCRGKVVVIAGQNLRPVFEAIMRQTLVSLGENGIATSDDQTVIRRVEISTL